MVDGAVERRREPGTLPRPVADHTARGHHEARTVEPTRTLFDQQVRQRLDRLAEPHVVGQDPAEAVAAQKPEPVQAPGLVVAEITAKGSRRLDHGKRLAARELLRELAQALAASPLHLRQREQASRIREGEPQRAVPPTLVEQLDQHVQDLREPLHRHRDLPTIGERECNDRPFELQALLVDPPAADRSDHQRTKVDALAVDLDPELELEPTVALLDVGVPRIGLAQRQRRIEVDLPALRLELPARRAEKLEPRPGQRQVSELAVRVVVDLEVEIRQAPQGAHLGAEIAVYLEDLTVLHVQLDVFADTGREVDPAVVHRDPSNRVRVRIVGIVGIARADRQARSPSTGRDRLHRRPLGRRDAARP